jgi:hypothetical protein
MTPPSRLSVELLSDATFASGEGTPGLVDLEVTATRDGLPYLRGKTLHGLLRDAWLAMRGAFPELAEAGKRLLGIEGDRDETALLRIGDAHLDSETVAWARYAVSRSQSPLHLQEILGSLTDIRTQTARSRSTGAPEDGTLRSSRVILRGTTFHAPLTFDPAPGSEELRCLALCVLATRHGGLGRNRGRGLLRCLLDGERAQTIEWAGLSSEVPR